MAPAAPPNINRIRRFPTSLFRPNMGLDIKYNKTPNIRKANHVYCRSAAPGMALIETFVAKKADRKG